MSLPRAFSEITRCRGAWGAHIWSYHGWTLGSGFTARSCYRCGREEAL